MRWIYVLGERSGLDLKIGHTGEATPVARLRSVNRDQTTAAQYVLLAAVRGTPKDEGAMRRPFRQVTTKGSRKEYVHPDPEAVGYVNWLRSRWFTTVDPNEPAEGFPVEDSGHWLPTDSRRIDPPDPDPDLLVQKWDGLQGPLSGTAWSWMTNPAESFQDYFTPPELVDAARDAMGGIDLDAASHWAANKVHRIPDYFDATRSAFENPWHGRVWLNPPYGENGGWFTEIERWTDVGEVTQLCMLSPVWAFTTRIARPTVERASGMVLLSPTPKFWGNKNPDRTGSNHPHAILYIGDHPDRFRQAFAPYGIGMELT